MQKVAAALFLLQQQPVLLPHRLVPEHREIRLLRSLLLDVLGSRAEQNMGRFALRRLAHEAGEAAAGAVADAAADSVHVAPGHDVGWAADRQSRPQVSSITLL